MDSILEVESLVKVYGKDESAVRAVDNASFRVNRGEFVLVVGSSGSGKSTLLNLIGLLDKPTSGIVRIDGVDTTTMNDGKTTAFRNRKLGFIFQFANLLTDLTVLENVMLPVQMAGGHKPREYATELLGAVGLKDQMHKRADRISGGQAQRAAIARGLANRPSLVLADEPTGNLDSMNSESVVQLMKSMCKKLGQSFVVVTHDREEFGEVDRIINMRDGRVFQEMAPEAVR